MIKEKIEALHVKTWFAGYHENNCVTKKIALCKNCCFLLEYFLIRVTAKWVVDIAAYEKRVTSGSQLLFI